MKKLINFLIIMGFIHYHINAQNLVPNPDFENYLACPNNQAQIYKATSWLNFGATPDYLNSCDLIGGVSVPRNFVGFQPAYSGDAYGCVGTYSNGGSDFREFIGAKLLDSLAIGTKYFVSFQISPAFLITSGAGWVFTNNMSALFTKSKIDSSIALATNNYHILNNLVISDTSNWTTVNGSFIADSNYKYIVIGNLLDDSFITIDSSYIAGTGCSFKEAYYYVDHVCVTSDSLYNISFLNSVFEDKTIEKEEINISFPNPTENYLELSILKADIERINFYDLLGNNIYSPKVDQIVDVSVLTKGVYILEIRLKKNQIITNKIIKN